MKYRSGECRNSVKILKEGFEVTPILPLNLVKEHRKSGVSPAVVDNNDVIQQKMTVDLPTVMVLTQPSLDVLETAKVFIKLLLSRRSRILIMLDSKEKEIIFV